LVEVYSKEEVKEFVIQRLHLTPKTLGKIRIDVPSIVRDIGGLQYGGHKIELFNRFENFESEWFDYWYENHTLVDGHVLRGALRIVNADEYPFYFKATRTVSRRRTYQKCPASLSNEHHKALNFIEKRGPFTPSEFKKLFSKRHPQLGDRAKRLLYDLYNYGKIARTGRKSNKPLYHSIRKQPCKLDMEQISEKEAEKWLFLKSLSIYGPLTLNDIAHWVGWTLTETKEISKTLLQESKIVAVKVGDQLKPHYLRVKDLDFLDSLRDNLPEHSFIRILFNDDALLLGYYRRLRDFFGYPWEYPQLSKGIVWRAAILHGRQLIGEAIIDMHTKSSLFKIRKLLLRKEFTKTEILSKIENEFNRHAVFQNKILQMSKPQLV
jgi:uncharacterized protein YcaQ